MSSGDSESKHQASENKRFVTPVETAASNELGTTGRGAAGRPLNQAAEQSEVSTTTTTKQSMPSGAKKSEDKSDISDEEDDIDCFYDEGEKVESEGRDERSARGIRVTFHALCPLDWSWNEEKRVVIRFGAEQLGNWKWNAITMTERRRLTVERKDSPQRSKEVLLHLVGNFVLPRELTSRAVPYKYAFFSVQKNRTEYEYLASGREGIFDRLLLLPECYHNAIDGFYIKYDVITRVPGWKEFFISMLSESHLDFYRKTAIEVFFPKWTGFYCHYVPDVNAMLAREALTDLATVVSQLSTILVQERDSGEVGRWPQRRLSVSMVLTRILKPKIFELGRLDGTKASERVVSALAIIVASKVYNLLLSTEDFRSLATALVLRPEPEFQPRLTLEAVKENFKNIQILQDSIYHLCSEICSKRNPAPEWILSVPLIHFLSNATKPFETPQINWKSKEWWGLGKLERAANLFRDRPKSKLFTLQSKLRPLVALDPLLFRLIIYVSPFADLEMWITVPDQTSEALVALVKKAEKLRYSSGPSFSDAFASVLDHTLGPLISLIDGTKIQTEMCEKHIDSTRLGIEVTLQLLNIMLFCFREKSSKKFYYDVISLLLSQLKLLDNLEGSGKIAEKKFATGEWRKEQLRRAAEMIAIWITESSLYFFPTVDTVLEDIRMWSDMIYTFRVKPDLADSWTMYLTKWFQNTFYAPSWNLLLTTFSALQRKEFHPSIHDCFLAVIRTTAKNSPVFVFQKLSTIAKNGSSRTFMPSLQLLEELLLSYTPAEEATDKMWLASILDWPLWKHYFRHTTGIFPESGSVVRRTLAKATNVITKLASNLSHAQITVEEMERIRKNQQRFLDVCKWIDESKDKEDHLLPFASTNIRKRQQELDCFYEKKKLVLDFVHVCQALGKIALDDVSDRASRDVSDQPIRNLVRRFDDDSIVVIHFALPLRLEQYVKPLSQLKPSTIFQQLWREQVNRVDKERATNEETAASPMTLDELVDLVIEPVFRKWQKICDRVKSGEISLNEVKECFRNLLQESENLRLELHLMNEDFAERGSAANWVTERHDQIRMYNTLNEAVSAARAVLRVCNVLNVSKPFPTFVEICQQDSPEFHMRPISSMTPNLLSAGAFLAHMTQNEIHCLNDFAGCEPLIRWVKEEIKEWKELETFVELAGTRCSAEGDLVAFKVAHLRAACAGFASFLFEFKENLNLTLFLDEVKLERDTARRDAVCLQKAIEELEIETQEAEARHARALQQAHAENVALQQQLEQVHTNYLTSQQQLEQARTALQSNLDKSRQQLDQAHEEILQLQKRLKESEKHCAQQTDAFKLARTELKQTIYGLRRSADIQKRAINEKDAKIQKLKEYENFLQISSKELEVSDVRLGGGAYGEVKVGKWRGAPVAVKTFHDKIRSEYNNRLFQREMEICSHVRHPNILAIVGVVTKGDTPLQIVTNLLEGSLSDVIKAAPSSEPLTLKEKVHLSIGFVSGISYLHQLRPTSVLHGDIRSTNILVTALMEAQVGDLGAARLSDASLSVGLHSAEYIAPERLQGGKNSEKADIYSLGVTLTELMICEEPDQEARYNQLLMIQYHSVQDICLQMVDDSPAKRPEASSCLEILQDLCLTREYRECLPRRMVKGKLHGQSTVTLTNCPW